MNLDDTGRVLAKAAAYDQRTIGDADILAWHEAIADLDAEPALTAVARYYATVTDKRIMPGHVRTLVGEIERETAREQRRAQRLALDPAHPLALQPEHPGDERPLTDRSAEIREFVDGVRGVLPAGRPDRLRYHDPELAPPRPRPAAEPNPDYDPAMATPIDWCASNRKPEPAWWENDQARERHAVELLANAGRLRQAAA